MNAQGKQLVSIRQVNHRDAARAIGAGPVSLVGSAAQAVANEAWAIGLDAVVIDDSKAPDVMWVARLGLIADPQSAPPRPLYLKEPET
ncbi:hypothetical protein ACKXGD_16425, partial [Enterococcus lactis]|uniref:hypothetical protein n=1 Tax=Enterococcus lactis TaxID=357441 RepID=UPI0039084206